MFSLHVLGRTDLRDAQGKAVDRVLAQPKRLALLAFLAVDRPRRLHRRDALLLLFWPESDETHARGALSQSLSFLRRELGDEAVEARGPEEVGLAEALVESDVERFDRHVEAGEWRRALHCYKGPLLPGFHLTGCNEFDDWLTATRHRLREQAVKCARTISREALGADDYSGAVAAAHHELHLAPLDDGAAQRSIAALALAGRPAAALEEYQAFVARLHAELGLKPSAALVALAERIRSGGRPSA